MTDEANSFCGRPIDSPAGFKRALKNEFQARYGSEDPNALQLIAFVMRRTTDLRGGEFTEADYIEKWGAQNG